MYTRGCSSGATPIPHPAAALHLRSKVYEKAPTPMTTHHLKGKHPGIVAGELPPASTAHASTRCRVFDVQNASTSTQQNTTGSQTFAIHLPIHNTGHTPALQGQVCSRRRNAAAAQRIEAPLQQVLDAACGRYARNAAGRHTLACTAHRTRNQTAAEQCAAPDPTAAPRLDRCPAAVRQRPQGDSRQTAAERCAACHVRSEVAVSPHAVPPFGQRISVPASAM